MVGPVSVVGRRSLVGAGRFAVVVRDVLHCTVRFFFRAVMRRCAGALNTRIAAFALSAMLHPRARFNSGHHRRYKAQRSRAIQVGGAHCTIELLGVFFNESFIKSLYVLYTYVYDIYEYSPR